MAGPWKNPETIVLHAGHRRDSATNAVAVPIYQTTSYQFDDTEHASRLFALQELGNIYTRIMNPTTAVLEARVAALEGGVAALAVSSGQAAEFVAIQNITHVGDNIVSSTDLYGGTWNLFANTFKTMGIDVRFVDPADPEAFVRASDARTRAWFAETLPNPKLQVLPIAEVAALGRALGIPLIVDNTAAPILARPLDLGAAVVVHSTTKYINGHSDCLGGVVATNEAAWQERMIFAQKALGLQPSPFDAWLTTRGQRTLALRMERHCANALELARWFETRPGVRRVRHPFLPSHPVFTARLDEDHSKKHIGPVAAAPWGSASILPISWMYIAMMGPDGLTEATKYAILNANYISKRLENYFPTLYKNHGLVAHECILDLRAFHGTTAEDVAKRLMDYGFHAPTLSWPVAGTLMVEPTESESKHELDRFCDAMISIHAEMTAVENGTADAKNNLLKNAPHTADQIASDNWNRPYTREAAAFPAKSLHDYKFWPHVSRVDNVFGDRNPVCSCVGMEAYPS